MCWFFQTVFTRCLQKSSGRIAVMCRLCVVRKNALKSDWVTPSAHAHNAHAHHGVSIEMHATLCNALCTFNKLVPGNLFLSKQKLYPSLQSALLKCPRAQEKTMALPLNRIKSSSLEIFTRMRGGVRRSWRTTVMYAVWIDTYRAKDGAGVTILHPGPHQMPGVSRSSTSFFQCIPVSWPGCGRGGGRGEGEEAQPLKGPLGSSRVLRKWLVVVSWAGGRQLQHVGAGSLVTTVFWCRVMFGLEGLFWAGHYSTTPRNRSRKCHGGGAPQLINRGRDKAASGKCSHSKNFNSDEPEKSLEGGGAELIWLKDARAQSEVKLHQHDTQCWCTVVMGRHHRPLYLGFF